MRSSAVQKHPLQLEFLGPDITKVPSVPPDPSVRVPWAKYYQKVLPKMIDWSEKNFPGTNTLAYFESASTTEKNVF
jgi:hypothetical protein